MDIETIEDFLSSLSQVSPVEFEIRNSNGFLFSSKGKEPDTADLATVEALASRVLTQTSIQRVAFGDQFTLFGVPIRNGIPYSCEC